jgi:hypothetical protein
MFSIRTKIKLASIVEGFTSAEIDRVLIVFNIAAPIDPNSLSISKAKKGNVVLSMLKDQGSQNGPFGKTNEEDLLQYIIDKSVNAAPALAADPLDFLGDPNPAPPTDPEDSFSKSHEDLANLLKQDGYIVKGKQIRSLIPDELAAAQVETELVRLLKKYGFATSEGHLVQAIDNHTNSNWAGANSQFRTFIESLLMEISNKLAPGNSVNAAAGAINVLTSTVNPPFLAKELNEVQSAGCPTPFVYGLWKRLHPEGSHPGLSDEEDCTFRYHMSTVFARYLLARLEKRQP